MDNLEAHEAFLRAIFDAPDDDTPRLVYADFLDENGDAERAELIRVQCEYARTDGWGSAVDERRGDLLAREYDLIEKLRLQPDDERIPRSEWYPHRGFRRGSIAFVSVDTISSPLRTREVAVARHPEWFEATRLKVVEGRVLGSEPLEVVFSSVVTSRVQELDVSGCVEASVLNDGAGFEGFPDPGYVLRPVITVAGVEALSRCRGARRLTALDLRNNNLDNDAARALIRSPYLDNLKRLDLLDGNRLRGRTWQQLLERFGPDVVG